MKNGEIPTACLFLSFLPQSPGEYLSSRCGVKTPWKSDNEEMFYSKVSYKSPFPRRCERVRLLIL
jgi:hypothetical protein